jgi:predicted metal-dependent hydrolase
MKATRSLLFSVWPRMQLGLPFEIREEPPLEFYYVRHQRARRYVLRLDLDGRVRVTIPRGGSRREADAFAERQRQWIREKVREHYQQRDSGPTIPVDETRRLRATAKSVLPARLMEVAAALGLTVARVSVRNQRSRWGSCGRDGHICLNWRLVLMPEWVRDYVLVHELMHLRRMDHSPKYWQLVAAAYPEYEAAREWLRRNGPGLR